MFRFLLTDKYTMSYLLIQSLLLWGAYRNFKRGYMKSGIGMMILTVVFNYLYLSNNYMVKWQ